MAATFGRCRPPSGVPTVEEASCELLGGTSDYHGDTCPVRPYDPESLSLPKGKAPPVQLTSLPDPVVSRLLEGFDKAPATASAAATEAPG